jgi:2-succinyl-5-enolpyruvyl-6-hydroxy-3-cyclohexene-1-carboxylate synthase
VLSNIHKSIPPKFNVHYANSTSVRYAQLFPHRNDLNYFANRGTSGIDGCTSTAAGYAHASKTPTLLITGDVAFFYDSNALWNHHLSEHLRIIMINNEGGNIFRIIDGPDTTDQLEKHFEAKHNTSAEHLAKTYNVPYYFCDDPESIEATLPDFFAPKNGRPAILEIKTPNTISAQVMRDLFKALEKQ